MDCLEAVRVGFFDYFLRLSCAMVVLLFSL